MTEMILSGKATKINRNGLMRYEVGHDARMIYLVDGDGIVIDKITSHDDLIRRKLY